MEKRKIDLTIRSLRETLYLLSVDQVVALLYFFGQDYEIAAQQIQKKYQLSIEQWEKLLEIFES